MAYLHLAGPSLFPPRPWNKRLHDAIQTDAAAGGESSRAPGGRASKSRGAVGILRSRPLPGCGDDDVATRARWRRVRFVDEAPAPGTGGPSSPPSPRGCVVTDTAFRPRTTDEERTLLYYDSHDYAFFALEDSLEEAEQHERKTERTFGWEDCVAYCDFDGHDFGQCDDVVFAEEDERGASPAIRKVETLRDLRI